MAFQPNQAATNSTGTQKESWANDFFLNFSLPDGKGGLSKLGSIGLKLSRVKERKLIDWINEDGGKHAEERCKTLVGLLVVEMRSAEPDETAGFALPV